MRPEWRPGLAIQGVGSFVRLTLVSSQTHVREGSPMMRVRLGADAEHCLKETFQSTPDRRLRGRCQAILMAARGRRHRLIAEDLGIRVRTLQCWLNTYQAGGLAGLTIPWATGRAPHIPAALAPDILT